MTVQPRRAPAGAAPPEPGRNFLTDALDFVLRRPETDTRVAMPTRADREDLSERIMQRVGVNVGAYTILNINRIAVEAPGRFVFERLLAWDADSSYWPNHIARAGRVAGSLDDIDIHLFGWSRLLGLRLRPLFHLQALRIHAEPDPDEMDNARFLLFSCSGGYPIGHFIMYVRSSIPALGETGPTQVFMAVGFNVYGRRRLGRGGPAVLVNRLWEALHDRVTANVLVRLKAQCEYEFRNYEQGS